MVPSITPDIPIVRRVSDVESVVGALTMSNAFCPTVLRGGTQGPCLYCGVFGCRSNSGNCAYTGEVPSRKAMAHASVRTGHIRRPRWAGRGAEGDMGPAQVLCDWGHSGQRNVTLDTTNPITASRPSERRSMPLGSSTDVGAGSIPGQEAVTRRGVRPTAKVLLGHRSRFSSAGGAALAARTDAIGSGADCPRSGRSPITT